MEAWKYKDQGAEDLVSDENLLPGFQCLLFSLYPHVVERVETRSLLFFIKGTPFMRPLPS